jgi:hypothetical protein
MKSSLIFKIVLKMMLNIIFPLLVFVVFILLIHKEQSKREYYIQNLENKITLLSDSLNEFNFKFPPSTKISNTLKKSNIAIEDSIVNSIQQRLSKLVNLQMQNIKMNHELTAYTLHNIRKQDETSKTNKYNLDSINHTIELLYQKIRESSINNTPLDTSYEEIHKRNEIQTISYNFIDDSVNQFIKFKLIGNVIDTVKDKNRKLKILKSDTVQILFTEIENLIPISVKYKISIKDKYNNILYSFTNVDLNNTKELNIDHFMFEESNRYSLIFSNTLRFKRYKFDFVLQKDRI